VYLRYDYTYIWHRILLPTNVPVRCPDETCRLTVGRTRGKRIVRAAFLHLNQCQLTARTLHFFTGIAARALGVSAL
jgi:hypothetical protein